MKETREKPTVFLGSSKESLPVLELIGKGLEPVATPVAWTDRSVFPVGKFVLDSLLELVPRFDFAVLVFGRDDMVVSRQSRLAAPRDNVIFELGLFMSHLERQRTLVVAPSGPNPRLKILSDLAGLNLAEYPQPRRKAELAPALQGVVEAIAAHIVKLGVRPAAEPAAYQGPRDVLNVGQSVEDLVMESWRAGRVPAVVNLGLDMEVTWRIVSDRLLRVPTVQNISWRSLMIDPESAEIQRFASGTVSTDIAALRIQEIRSTRPRTPCGRSRRASLSAPTWSRSTCSAAATATSC